MDKWDEREKECAIKNSTARKAYSKFMHSPDFDYYLDFLLYKEWKAKNLQRDVNFWESING